MMSNYFYVYSTMSTDVAYTFYGPAVEGQVMKPIIKTITINGGANVANKNFITPKGMITRIDGDAEMEMLMGHNVFKRHLDNGFLAVETVKADPDEVATNLVSRDESAPLTVDDFPEELRPKSAMEESAARPVATPTRAKRKGTTKAEIKAKTE